MSDSINVDEHIYQYPLGDPRYPKHYLDTSKIPVENLAQAMYDYTCMEFLYALRSKRKILEDDIHSIAIQIESNDLCSAVEDLDKSKILDFLSYVENLTKHLILTTSVMRGIAYHIPQPSEEVKSYVHRRFSTSVSQSEQSLESKTDVR